MRSVYMGMLPLLAIGTLSALSMPAAAQSESPCTTKSECDARLDAIDAKNRREAWDASVKRENDYAIQSAQLRAQARSDASAGRLSRAQDIMHRRHVESAAATADPKN